MKVFLANLEIAGNTAAVPFEARVSVFAARYTLFGESRFGGNIDSSAENGLDSLRGRSDVWIRRKVVEMESTLLTTRDLALVGFGPSEKINLSTSIADEKRSSIFT